MTILKTSNCDKAEKIKVLQNLKPQIVTKSKTHVVTKLKKSNCDTTQKLKLWQNSNCDKTQKLNCDKTKKK